MPDAPHGPADPLDPRARKELVNRCHARSRSTGRQCGNRARIGQRVCRMHGGSSPQALKKARENLAANADALMDSLIRLAMDETIPPRDRIFALKDALDRAGYAAPRDLNISATVTNLPDDWQQQQSAALEAMVAAKRERRRLEQERAQHPVIEGAVVDQRAIESSEQAGP